MQRSCTTNARDHSAATRPCVSSSRKPAKTLTQREFSKTGLTGLEHPQTRCAARLSQAYIPILGGWE
eukprot:4397155-Amphidinium_carterae.2